MPPKQLFSWRGSCITMDNHNNNHCGISLLSTAWKVLARVLLNRLNEHLEQSELLPDLDLDLERTEEQLTRSSQQGNFKINTRNRNGPLHGLS